MIVILGQGDDLTLVAQDDHAHLAGDFAARLDRDIAADSGFVAAARLHDNGWREEDVQPTVDAAGGVHSFMTLDGERYAQVWERGIARARAIDPWVGLLVSLHGSRFLGGRPETAPLLAAQRTAQQEGAFGTAVDPTDLDASVAGPSDWIAALDGLSLMVCRQLAARMTLGTGDDHIDVWRHGGEVTIDPWPFRGGAFEVSVPARRLEGRRCADDVALAVAWRTATDTEVAATLRPATALAVAEP